MSFLVGFVLACLLLVSPSVLDRLNPLLEPNGVLAIDERGLQDGEVVSIRPHPNFRWVFMVNVVLLFEGFPFAVHSFCCRVLF